MPLTGNHRYINRISILKIITIFTKTTKITLSVHHFYRSHHRRSRVFWSFPPLLWSGGWFSSVGLKCHRQGKDSFLGETSFSGSYCPSACVKAWQERKSWKNAIFFSCSCTHFTGIWMGDLERCPAFQGHSQGLWGTPHRPWRGGREESNARCTRLDGGEEGRWKSNKIKDKIK